MENIVDKKYEDPRKPRKRAVSKPKPFSIDWYLGIVMILGVCFMLCVATVVVVSQHQKTLRECIEKTDKVLACKI